MQMRMQIARNIGLLTTIFFSGFIKPVLADIQTAHLSTKTECILISNARLALPQKNSTSSEKSFETKLRAANYGHEVEAGNAYVFSLRQFDDDDKGVDSARFLKITLELAAITLDPKPDLSQLAVLRGYYSAGGVGFIPKGEYFRARDPLTAISIKQTKDEFTAVLHAKFIAKRESDGMEKEVNIDLKCPIRIASVGDLEPWEGKIGASWNSFSPIK